MIEDEIRMLRNDHRAVILAHNYCRGEVQDIADFTGDSLELARKATEIQADVIAKIDPLDGAKEFLDALRAQTQVLILSDTFYEFAMPLMKKLGYPTLMCNQLEVDANGKIVGYRMRCAQSKLTTVKALQSCGFTTLAAGDSFNDLGMIRASRAGFLFRSTDKIKADNPDLPAFETYQEFLTGIEKALRY